MTEPTEEIIQYCTWFKPSSHAVKFSIKCLPMACLRAVEPPGVVFGLFKKLPV